MASKRSSLKPLASVAFKEQSGCCIYCDKPMWLNDPEPFARQFNLTPKQLQQLQQLQCTGEHLFRHSSGGKASRKISLPRIDSAITNGIKVEKILRLMLFVRKCSGALVKGGGFRSP
jgi:hypothetical protein